MGLETTVIVNSNGVGHVGVITGAGADRTLYDPAGSYPGKGSGDALYGRDANLGEYLDFQRLDGPNVSIYTFNTSRAEEQQIIENIQETGGCFILGCAICTGNVLRGVGPFKDLGSTFTPAGTAREIQNLLRR